MDDVPSYRWVEEPQTDGERRQWNRKPQEVVTDIFDRESKLSNVVAVDDVLTG